MNIRKLRTLIVLTTAALMMMLSTAIAGAQTTALPDSCEINEIGDAFVEVYCTIAYTFDSSVYLGVELTNEGRGLTVYQITAATNAGGFTSVDIPAGALADAASDGLGVDLNLYVVQGSVTTPQDVDDVTFTAADLDPIDLTPRAPNTVQAIPDGSDNFSICENATRDATNTDCEVTAVSLDSVQTIFSSPLGLIAIALVAVIGLTGRSIMLSRD